MAQILFAAEREVICEVPWSKGRGDSLGDVGIQLGRQYPIKPPKSWAWVLYSFRDLTSWGGGEHGILGPGCLAGPSGGMEAQCLRGLQGEGSPLHLNPDQYPPALRPLHLCSVCSQDWRPSTSYVLACLPEYAFLALKVQKVHSTLRREEPILQQPQMGA